MRQDGATLPPAATAQSFTQEESSTACYSGGDYTIIPEQGLVTSVAALTILEQAFL